MIWLLIFIIIAGYIVTEHKKIIMQFKMLWDRIK